MDNVLKLLGLINRARKLCLGENILENMKDVKLLLIASDISPKSKERYLKKCSFYNIDYFDCFNSDELSKAIGKKNIKTIGILDEGFSLSIKNKMGEGKNG